MKNRIRKSLITISFLLFLAAVAALYTQVYLIPKVTGALTSTAIATYDTMSEQNGAACLIIREEQVVYANAGGTVSYYSKEGEKTRLGTKVLDVYPSGRTAEPSNCPLTGFVSYYIDGCEDVYSADPESLDQLTPEDVTGKVIAAADVTEKNCSKGDALYKLVSNDTWYMVLVSDAKFQENYAPGQSITVCFRKDAVKQAAAEAQLQQDASEKEEKSAAITNGKTDAAEETSASRDTFELLPSDLELVRIPAAVVSAELKDGKLMVIASTRRWYEDFAKLRTTDVNVVTRSCEGLVIPASALTEEEGIRGVYQKLNTGGYAFLPVKILGEDGTSCIVAPTSFEMEVSDGTKETVNTIKIYDEILRNAGDRKSYE